MARQITYANDSSVSALDRLTGIDSVDRSTKNFTIEAIAQLFASTGLADVSKLAFFYNYNSNMLASQGQAYYGFIAGLENTPVGVNSITFSRFDSLGKDFEPLRGALQGSHLKLTSVGNAGDTNYGLYQISGTPNINGDTITINVNHLASSGTLPDSQISLSYLASSVSGQGVQVFDGQDVPTFGAPVGAIYFRFDETTTPHTAEVYIRTESQWIFEASLVGQRGEVGPIGPQGPIGPDGPRGPQGDNIVPADLLFTERMDGTMIDVTYNGADLGSYPAPEDGTNVTGLVQENTPAAGQTTVTITSDGTPMSFVVQDGANGDTITVTRNTDDDGITVTSSGGTAQDVLDGADGDTVTVTRNAADDGVTITSSGGTSQDILDGTVGDTITVERNTADDGITVTSSGGTSQDVLDGSDGDTIAVARNAANNGITVTSSGGTSQDVLDGSNGIQGSITFRYYRGVPFTDPNPAPITIVVTDAGLINVIPDWDHTGVPATYDPSTENLWVAEYIWNPADAGETEVLNPFKETGPQGPGSGSSDVDGIKVEGTTLSLDEAGTAVGITVPIAQGTADNDTLASQGYVDDGLGDKEDTISATNRVDAEFVGTGAITNAEFNTLDGVTSSIQTQFTGKVNVDGDQVINGNKVFSQTPKGANPSDTSNDTSLATTNWVRGHIGTGGAGATNLGVANRDGDSLDITSSNGDNATVPSADTTFAGLLAALDKDKLDTVARNADVTPGWVPSTDPGYVTGLPTNLINGQNLAAAQSTLGINPDAEQNVQADWLQGNNTQDNYIENKPTALSDFDNDELFIDLQEVPVRTATLVRGTMDNISISGGNLAIVLATPSVSGFTYSFTPNQVSQVDGAGTQIPFTIALTGLDVNHTAEIMMITPITGFTFNIAADGQSFTATPDPTVLNVGFVQNIIPTVESTNIGTGDVNTHTTVTVPYSVIAAPVAPVQSDYFYYGNVGAAVTSNADLMTAITAAEIATGAAVDGGIPAAAGVTRGVVASPNIPPLITGGAAITFFAFTGTALDVHEITAGGGGFPVEYDYMNDVIIGGETYTVGKFFAIANTNFLIE